MSQELPEEDSIQDTILKHGKAFMSCYAEAFLKLHIMMESSLQTFYIRSKATLLHNIMVNEVKNALYKVPGIKIYEKFETIIVIIDNKVMARFKKLDSDGHASNNPTQRNSLFITSQLAIPFEVADAKPRQSLVSIDVGYKIDQLWTKYNALQLVCNSESWSIPLNDDTITKYSARQRNKNKGSEGDQQKQSNE